jgi:uncharacterized Zn finger protein
MSRFGDRDFFPSQPKRPPPEHGIKIRKAGTTWWGQLWIAALERMSAGYSNRLARGRTYARAGRTHDLEIISGQVTAQVTGSRKTPYRVTLRLVPLSDAVWEQAIRAMADKARFSAELLLGRMPKDIEEAFQSGGASLFPAAESDLVTECTCPDWANPCKHVAATHYVLGESLDRDPFLLFELRGRTKEQVLGELRSARIGADAELGTKERSLAAGAAVVPSVMLGELKAEDYERPREGLPALQLSFERPSAPAAILRQLGAPLAWSAQESPADLLQPRIHAAALRARSIALGDISPAAETASEAVDRPFREPEPRPSASKAESSRKRTRDAPLPKPAKKALKTRPRRPKAR